MDGNELKTLLGAQQGELDAVLMYQALANAVREQNDAQTFRRLAAEEGRHAAVFKELTQRTLKPKKTLATLLPILYRLLGRKRLYPIIAKFEYAAVDNYAPVAERFPEVQSVRDDEKRHGDTVKGLLE
ncbi:MAG: rubrerythrin [Clostridia bacterium]|nr:rubrerythrin [Clostridia bacterium]MBR5428038.1 rubrerythrin [Clostridia bacterium]